MDKEKTYIFHTGSGETIEEAYQDAIDEFYLHHDTMPEVYKEVGK